MRAFVQQRVELTLEQYSTLIASTNASAAATAASLNASRMEAKVRLSHAWQRGKCWHEFRLTCACAIRVRRSNARRWAGAS